MMHIWKEQPPFPTINSNSRGYFRIITLQWFGSVHQASYNQVFVPIFHKNTKMADRSGSVPAQATNISYEGDKKNVIVESPVPEVAPEKVNKGVENGGCKCNPCTCNPCNCK